MSAMLLLLPWLAADLQIDASGPVNSVRIAPGVSVYRGATGKVLLTSARRDLITQPAGAAIAELVVPKVEEGFFTKPGAFWDLFWETRFHDYDARQSKWPAASFPGRVTPVAGGDRFESGGGIQITVLDTPGFTRGSISYLAAIDGRKYAFTGDLIYDGGRIWDLYSLQDAIPDVSTSTRVGGRNTVRGYHGFAARASDLMASLRKIRDAKPDVIVPARGQVIQDPEAAIGKLLERLQSLMLEHFSTDALRWYWGDDNLRQRAAKMGIDKPQWMEMAQTRALPEYVIPIQNSRLIVSRSGAAFLIDCGNERIYDEVEKMRLDGQFRKLEAIFITHYHDDHTDYVAEASRRRGAPVSVVNEMRDIIARPEAYRMPAMTRNPIPLGEPVAEGARKQWHEFEMEFAYFPGQTFYHGVLVLTHQDSGTRIVFGGDSFTPSGIDDYCLLNRDLLDENQGYLYCLRYLRRLSPGAYLTNQHVQPMWTYTPAQLDRMEESLRRRGAILRDLFPWDSPNYGVDEQWARFYPYTAETEPGKMLSVEVRVTNHSPARREFAITPQLPAGWKVVPTTKIVIEAGKDGAARFRVQVPPDATRGSLAILTADVASRDMRFPSFIEAMVRIR